MTALRVALVGAPNSGKSTLFNGLTGGRAKVANYAGVTVERREGMFATPAGRTIELIDLPGIHGLHPRSLDEKIAVEAIAGDRAHEHAPDGLIVLIDAADLRTHLPLALQIKALGWPMVLSVNMMDLAERDGVKLDLAALERELGVPVVGSRATRKAGREALVQRLDGLIDAGVLRAGEGGEPAAAPEIATLQREARRIAKAVIVEEPALNRFTREADRIVLHPVLGPIVLAAILFFMFQAVYAWAAAPMDLIDGGFAALGEWVGANVSHPLLRSFLSEAVIGGVGSVIVFLPQIVVLFALILLLEASGYMARAAFLMDELMLRVGLNGRAFIPLLSSFACAIPGMMAARTIESERDRLTTILVAPLMTCSARLPVYTLIIAAFIPRTQVGPFGLQGIVMFGLYLAGVLSAVLVAFLLKRTVTKGAPQPLMMELPTYKAPDARDFFVTLFSKAWAFLRRAGTLIFATAVALWALASLPVGAPSVRESYAGMIGRALEPIFAPIGFNLEIVIALVPGMAAREVAVGALGTVYAMQGDVESGLGPLLREAWSLPTALAFLAWYVYAPQCLASIAVARREMNSWRWTAFLVAYLFAAAYLAAGATYWIARMAGL